MTPSQELALIRKKQEIITATIAVDLTAELKSKTKAGNPAEWKNPSSAPKGYVGGQLQRSWIMTKADKYTWIINNNMQYAERRFAPLSPDGYYGRPSLPAGIQPTIDTYERKLQSALNKI